MTLPEVCPLDENQTCKGRECHLFCLEWRTREPTCLIGYNTTSKVRSGRTDSNRDTYAEDTFRKLGRQPLPRRKSSSEKGDWTPTRSLEKPSERPVERKEEKPFHDAEKNPQKLFFGCREASTDSKPEENPVEGLEERLKGRQTSREVEKASLRLEARLKEDPVEEDPIIYAKLQLKTQEKLKASEKVISRDKHVTIFASCDEEEKKNIYSSGKEEKTRKEIENKEKHKKLDKIMEIDLPDNNEEEFWS